MLAGLALLLIGLGVAEFIAHQRALHSIPIRIHVNGTRGKSSVVRLIAAGLRAGGIKTCAKTTGTLARMILPEGQERPVFRPARANVLEQVRIVRSAAQFGAEALIIECMALQPYLQWLSEARFVQATHGIITNARADHLEVMGPTERDVCLALCGMIPPKAALYTAERKWLPLMSECVADREARLIAIGEESVGQITPADLAGFKYTEHPDNLALALRVCTDLGVDRQQALEGMWAATPDPGAMTEHRITFFGRQICFINGFAANDPESTLQIWKLAQTSHPECTTRIVVLNCRADRSHRSRQLGAASVDWEADQIVIVGSGTYVFGKAAIEAGVSPERLSYAEDQRVDAVFETLMGLSSRQTLIMGLGNIGGIGLSMVRYFKNREAPPAEESA